jgi:hypothetical protein
MCIFSREKRFNFIDEAIKKSDAPGPGKYKNYSEFQSRKSYMGLNE